MPSLSDLYNVRPTIEENSRNSLLAAGFDKVFTRLNGVADLQKDRPRLELKAFVGAQTARALPCIDGHLRRDEWNFTLQIAVVTAPGNDSDANVLHDAFCGAVRSMLSTFGQLTQADTTNWPSHCLSNEPLTETGTQSDLKTDDGYEVSVITVAGVIVIRKSAFDAALTN